MNKKLLLLCLLTGFSAIKADALPIHEATSPQLIWQVAKNTVNYGLYPLAETATKASVNSLTEAYKQNPAAFTGWSTAIVLGLYVAGPSIWTWLKANYREKIKETKSQSSSQSIEKEKWTGWLSMLNYVPFVR